MELSKASKAAGGLLALTGIIGIVLLATDQILRGALGGTHFYALIAFVTIDFAVAGYLLARPSKMSLTLTVAWSVLRLVLQFANIYIGPAQEGTSAYADFANYIFNPTLTTAPNPPRVPGALIDFIVILEIVVIGIAWSARSAQK